MVCWNTNISRKIDTLNTSISSSYCKRSNLLRRKEFVRLFVRYSGLCVHTECKADLKSGTAACVCTWSPRLTWSVLLNHSPSFSLNLELAVVASSLFCPPRHQVVSHVHTAMHSSLAGHRIQTQVPCLHSKNFTHWVSSPVLKRQVLIRKGNDGDDRIRGRRFTQTQHPQEHITLDLQTQ